MTSEVHGLMIHPNPEDDPATCRWTLFQFQRNLSEQAVA